MKFILVVDGIVAEIIPEFSTSFPDIPVRDRYTKEFLGKTVRVPDELDVEQNWIYDPAFGAFTAPREPPETVTEKAVEK